MQAYRRNGSTPPLILNHTIRWRWVAKIRNPAALPPGNNPGAQWIRSWMCPPSRADRTFRKEKNLLSLMEFEPQITAIPVTLSTLRKYSRSEHAKVITRCRVQLKCDGTWWRTGGEVKGKLANGVGSHYSSHYVVTWCIQHYYRWCAQLGCH